MFQFNENVYPGSKFCKSEQHSMTETGKASVEYSVACSLYLDLKWINVKMLVYIIFITMKSSFEEDNLY